MRFPFWIRLYIDMGNNQAFGQIRPKWHILVQFVEKPALKPDANKF